MQKSVDAYLWKIGPDFMSKKGAFAGQQCRLFVFKDLQTEKEYKANLPINNIKVQGFLNYGQVGNVFYGLQLQGLHPNNIDYFKGFTRVETKKKYEEVHGSL